ncbi:[LysW]-aminoadipate kinase [candidate division KSB1 bacterium]|nr:[LysW]-aminoadipate kinase [candidate division KSB1 bacterium]
MMIIKIGGGKDINIKGIITDLAGLEQQFIIVHGANALRDELAEKLGMPRNTITSVSGYTSVFSDENAIDVMMMAYAGLKNKRIVELCQQHGINAIGLTGLDGRAVQGQRNKGIRVKEGGKVKIVRDYSGKPKNANTDLLFLLLSNGYTPVLTVPILDENNVAVNTENDDIVRILQEQMQFDIIIQLIEAPGFLDNPDDPNSLVDSISSAELERREQQVTGRMKRKMLALRKLFDSGAAKVIISDGRVEHPVQNALTGKGTEIS